MIAFEMVLLTELEDVNTTPAITVQVGTERIFICAEAVRHFVRATNKGYTLFPHEDVLTAGLEFIRPELQEVMSFLYEELKEVIT